MLIAITLLLAVGVCVYRSNSDLVLGLHLPELLSEPLTKCCYGKLCGGVEFEFAGHGHPMTPHAVHHYNATIIHIVLNIVNVLTKKGVRYALHFSISMSIACCY